MRCSCEGCPSTLPGSVAQMGIDGISVHGEGDQVGDEVKTQVILLNGSSSSGKTTIARCLKAILPTPWISLSIDDLLRALPPSLMDSHAGIAFGEHGEITIGEGFREIASGWLAGLAAMARAGTRIIYDDVFLSGAESQARLQKQLVDVSVLWVGVHCDAEVAAGREVARGDRVVGGAASQSTKVHEGVTYDLEVDTTRTESMDCACIIAGRVS
jgi:chloramphenicol 3-O phosphotransferase